VVVSTFVNPLVPLLGNLEFFFGVGG